MAGASRKNWKVVVMGKVEPLKHDEKMDEATGNGKKQVAAQLANNMAYEVLLLSGDTKDLGAFVMIDEAKNEKLPNSNAALAWKTYRQNSGQQWGQHWWK